MSTPVLDDITVGSSLKTNLGKSLRAELGSMVLGLNPPYTTKNYTLYLGSANPDPSEGSIVSIILRFRDGNTTQFLPQAQLDINQNVNLTSAGASYKIQGNDILTSTVLGSTVTSSSLTSIGTLSSLTVTGDVTIDSSTLKVDSANNRVGIVNASPAYPLDITGDCNLSSGSSYRINGVSIYNPSMIFRTDVYSANYQQVLNSGNTYYGHRLNNTGTTNIILNCRVPPNYVSGTLKVSLTHTVDWNNQGTANNVVYNTSLLRLVKSTLESSGGVSLEGAKTSGTSITVQRPAQRYLRREIITTNLTVSAGDSIIGYMFRDGDNVADTYAQDTWVTDICFFVE